MDQREVAWGGAHDVRDLGGLPVAGGGMTRPGVFYRSASPRFMTSDGWQQAYEAGVRTVVDLRRDEEVVADPSPTADAAQAAGLAVVRADLDGPKDDPVWGVVEASDLDGTPLYLRLFIDAQPGRVASVVTTLARAPEGGVATARSGATAPGWSRWCCWPWRGWSRRRPPRTTSAPARPWRRCSS